MLVVSLSLESYGKIMVSLKERINGEKTTLLLLFLIAFYEAIAQTLKTRHESIPYIIGLVFTALSSIVESDIWKILFAVVALLAVIFKAASNYYDYRKKRLEFKNKEEESTDA